MKAMCITFLILGSALFLAGVVTNNINLLILASIFYLIDILITRSKV